MTKEKLLKKLIYHYEWCIEYLPKKDWGKFINRWEVHLGACFLSKVFYGKHIYDEEWVKKHCLELNYAWGRYPVNAKSREECIKLLEIRLTELKKELKIILLS